MRRGGKILVVLGLLLGLITAAVTFMMLANIPEPTTPIATRSVVVALQNIGGRSEIITGMVGTAQYPAEAVPSGVYESTLDVVGKVALLPIYPGQLVMPQMVAAKPPQVITPTGSIASFVIPEGKVAMAFQVSDITGVAGAVQPGDTVDILLTLQSSQLPASPTPTPARPGTQAATTGMEGLPATQLLLQDVLVLHVGAWAVAQASNAPPSSILTFVLDRQDALTLKGAQEQGKIDLVLRRAGDRRVYDTEPVTLQYLNRRFKFNLVPGSTGR